MLRSIQTLALAAFLAACGAPLTQEPAPSSTPGPTPLGPVRVRGPVFVESSEILMLESFPVQVRLHVAGTLPTPCHELMWDVADPDEEGRILVDLYSESDPGLACIQIIEPFDVSIPLGSYAEGSFTVWLNAEKVGEISLP
jgi:hypothetical protein